MKEKTKENAIELFDEMIKNSWTYGRMTKFEQNRWIEILHAEYRTKSCLKGNFKQRWNILNALYNAYLIGIGYDGFTWREK